MNKSFSKIRHIQESNIKLEKRILNEEVDDFDFSGFVKDGETSALWDGRFQQAMSEITLNDAKSTWSGTSLTTFAG